jgi:hypothetical protein
MSSLLVFGLFRVASGRSAHVLSVDLRMRYVGRTVQFLGPYVTKSSAKWPTCDMFVCMGKGGYVHAKLNNLFPTLGTLRCALWIEWPAPSRKTSG